jgi:hypothetical protein
MTTMVLLNQEPARSWQLIKRDFDTSSPTYGEDLMTLDLLGPNSAMQGVSLGQTLSGFYHVPRTPIRQSWSYQEGSIPSDFPRVEERLLDFRLITRGATAAEWERVDSMLWQILTYTDDCVIRVTSGTSEPRELKLRLDRKPKDAWTFDPGTQHHYVWDITAVACDPYWYGRELTSTWTNNAGTGSGYLTLQNPSDVECWVQFASNTITGSVTWTLPDGISGRTLALPTLTSGQEFLVNTYPLAETLSVMDNSQAWAKMNAKAFLYSIPPGTPPTQVPVSVVGGNASTSITAYMSQRFERPWSVTAPWKNNIPGLGNGGLAQ